MPKPIAEQIDELQRAIQAQESLRTTIGNDVVDAALTVLRQKLNDLEHHQVEEKSREQRKMVTVMYADISGFTALAEKMDDEDIAEAMNVFWSRIDTIIQSHGGHIDKHIGDNVVALWGVQAAREDDAERAVRAALNIQQEVPVLTQKHPFQMHIAIHSGQVMLGEIGTTHEYTAVGHTIQVASDLENEARPGEVIISQDTLRLVRGLFDVESCSEVTIPGSNQPLAVFRVLRARPYVFRPHTRGVEGIETRMVGRDAELAVIQDALRSVLYSKKARTITVIGEAGIGKSRLLYEFEAWLEHRARRFWVLKGRATERMTSVPYSFLHEIFAQYLNIPDDAPLEQARQTMEAAIIGLLPNDTSASERAHFIGHLLGFDFSNSPDLSGILSDPGQIRDRARYHLAQMITSVTKRQPVMLLLEDLHWADEASLDLLAYVVTEGQELPILFIGLARPILLERLPDWWQRLPGQQRLELAPLNETASRSLVREILQKAASVPPALDELVIAGAEGNPFYVEELIKVLIDEHVILTGETWTVDESRLGEVRVPSTLTGILQARLDGLPVTEHTVLQAASALGRAFWDGALASLTGFDTDVVSAALDGLEMRELVFPHRGSSFGGQREYVFKHALLRQVTYESVLKRQRRKYHLSAAEWLIYQSRERASEYAALIAGHFEFAEDLFRASTWYGQAGKQAYEAYAPDSAVAYYEKALTFALQTSLPEKEALEWYENMGKALFALARYEEALNAYQEMRAVAERTANINGLAQAWYNISYVHDHMGSNSLSLESAENALRLVDKGIDVETLIKVMNGKAWALYRLGEASHAMELGKKTLRLARALNDPIVSQREMGQAYQLLGAAYELLGNLKESQECEAQALVIFRGLGNRRGEAAMLNNQGVGAFVRGGYNEAIARYAEALEVAQQIGSHDRISMFLSNLGGARAAMGNYVAAEADIRRSLAALGTTMTHFLPLTYVFLAEALLGQDKFDEGCEAAQTGLKLAQESEQPDVISAAYRMLGNCGAKRIEHGLELVDSFQPEKCYQESIRVAREIGSEADQARTLKAWAAYEKAHGDPQKAESLHAEALALFKKLELLLEVERLESKT
jgi:class 3 adenylate cyclase/tetratricopeptide (TPR) repeat protein